jgi:hypothetical protein
MKFEERLQSRSSFYYSLYTGYHERRYFMNRTTAIILTVVTAVLCGLPGLGLICFGALAAIAGQSPEVMRNVEGTAQDLYLGVAIFVCGGLLMLVVPLVVGYISFQMSKSLEESPSIKYDEPFPPAS